MTNRLDRLADALMEPFEAAAFRQRRPIIGNYLEFRCLTKPALRR